MQYMRMFFKFPNIPASINKCLNHKLPLANASGITCFETFALPKGFASLTAGQVCLHLPFFAGSVTFES